MNRLAFTSSLLLLCLSWTTDEAGASMLGRLYQHMAAFADDDYARKEQMSTTSASGFHNEANSTTSPPSLPPPPSNHSHNETVPPSPSNHSLAPTPAHNATFVPHNSTTDPPSPSNHTQPPSPSNHTSNHTTLAPTPASHHQNHSNVSTTAPSAAPDEDVVPRMSFWGIVRKTIAWLIFIALSVLAFGACMSHRYRIYFFLRGVWYTVLRMQCTQWIFRKLRIFGGDQQVDSGLNTIIFDSEMSDGLLLNENNRDD